MTWNTPSFIEINMSAEIGGYQDDGDRGNQPPAGPLPVVQPPETKELQQ